jgi:outer membrane protein TolC
LTLAVVVSLTGAHASFAQTKLSIKDAVSLALSRRAELRANLDRVESSGGLRQPAAVRPNPRLILQTEDLRTSNFNLGQDSQSYLYASQVFEARGKRSGRIAVADQIVARNRAQVDSVRRQIDLNVRQTYWQAEAAQMVRDLMLRTTTIFNKPSTTIKHDSMKANSAEVDLLRVRLERERIHAAAENANL